MTDNLHSTNFEQELQWFHVVGTEAFERILEADFTIVSNDLAQRYGEFTNSFALTANIAHEALRNTVWITDEAERELIMKGLDDQRRTYHRVRHLAGLHYIPELTE
jgi:hypothetical protein